ncbi:tRNA (adenosine(37)-N6)-threonylcarbamoyltransferase complex transferase subunit TsaD [Desulfosediminicola flagellatus]|uniref:tRNA (adenosine(37)-N6)-threonylcarbamoyltransferase complex transferase subunit TsaD n=1 Tax=Desulfosediminicola flagellatus TaxID=2569541 RepID=UPI0010ABC2EA|nr:tRNA (adenosine(37)-N6)-threonylcarbamoyltransferase complex transferase subunit TsaD [Desulfosediminicola flagellatus]
MRILGIESSCDDTAAAVIEDGNKLLSNVLSSQDEIHSRYGGVVPELASRNHLENIHPIVFEALARANITLDDIDLIATTQGPGLIGSLLVGFSFAKSLAFQSNTPYIGVDHMSGHLLSVFLEHTVEFPYVALIASGGTSSIFLVKSFTEFQLLGRTRDDAAGEAFDKVAKLLQLPYPGGPHVSKYASSGDGKFVKFPRAWLEEDSLDFSFSGVKTAVLNHCNQQQQKDLPLRVEDICASFQEAVVDVLTVKTVRAAKKHKVKSVVLGGGVSANSRLREVFSEICGKNDLNFHVPHPKFCTDNGAMIALAGYHKFNAFGPMMPEEDVYSRSILG